MLALFDQGYDFSISAITYYEIYTGANAIQLSAWEQILHNIHVVPFDTIVAQTAVEINAHLKSKRKQIQMADLFIAATAIANKLPIATLNKKHFERIDTLEVI